MFSESIIQVIVVINSIRNHVPELPAYCPSQFQAPETFFGSEYFWPCLGLASAILIFLYVSDELSYDTMHPHYKNTYRIGATFINPDGQLLIIRFTGFFHQIPERQP